MQIEGLLVIPLRPDVRLKHQGFHFDPMLLDFGKNESKEVIVCATLADEEYALGKRVMVHVRTEIGNYLSDHVTWYGMTVVMHEGRVIAYQMVAVDRHKLKPFMGDERGAIFSVDPSDLTAYAPVTVTADAP